MRKIPVFGTIAGAYGFTLGNLGTIIGLIWLPMVALVALQYYVTVRYLNGYLSAFAQGNLYELNSATGLRYLSMAFAFLLQAILITPVMRQALGLRSGGAFVSFALGPTTLRVFGAMVALTLVLIAIEYIALIPMAVVVVTGVIAAKTVEPIHGMSALVVGAIAGSAFLLIFVAAMIYIWLRLSFFVIAVAAAEKKIDLIRAWRLTSWSFWRIFIVKVATVLPIAIVYLALIWAALGFPIPHMPSPDVTAGWKGAPTKALTWIVQLYVSRMPYLLGVAFVLAPFSVGLSTGAAAAAYRAVVPPSENNGPASTPTPETSAA